MHFGFRDNYNYCQPWLKFVSSFIILWCILRELLASAFTPALWPSAGGSRILAHKFQVWLSWYVAHCPIHISARFHIDIMYINETWDFFNLWVVRDADFLSGATVVIEGISRNISFDMILIGLVFDHLWYKFCSVTAQECQTAAVPSAILPDTATLHYTLVKVLLWL